jgi:hypothetical protein
MRTKIISAALVIIMVMTGFMPWQRPTAYAESGNSGVLPGGEATSPAALSLRAAAFDAAASPGEFLAPIDPPDPNAILIHNAQELNDIRNNLSASYVLANDIDLSSWNNWIPIGSDWNGNYTPAFTGEFDGQGHIISNLTITEADIDNPVGLFGLVYSAAFKNVGLENINIIVENESIGGLFGREAHFYNSEPITVKNCYSTGNIICETQIVSYIGGLVGYCQETYFVDCYNTADIIGSGSVGGIVGLDVFYSYDAVPLIANNCHNYGDITSIGHYMPSAGGIAGHIYGEVIDCYNSGAITSEFIYIDHNGTDFYGLAGGIAGSARDSILKRCYNSGYIYASSDVSSVVANRQNSVYAGGLTGECVKIEESSNSGKINLSVSNSFSTSITGYAGGITGRIIFSDVINESIISDCYNTAKIEASVIRGWCTAGGIAGQSEYGHSRYASILNCYSSGNITGIAASPFSGVGVGGINSSNHIVYVDYSVVLSDELESMAMAYDFYYNQVLIPYPIKIINDSHTKTEVLRNYALDDIAYEIVNGDEDDSDGRISRVEARNKTIYESLGWDFDTVWKMPESGGYPILQWQSDDETRVTPTPAPNVKPVEGNFINKLLTQKSSITEIDGEIYDQREYTYKIIAAFINNNVELVKNVSAELTLDSRMKFAPGETPLKTAGDIKPDESMTVSWSVTVLGQHNGPDLDLDYSALIKADNTDSFSLYGNLFIEGSNTSNNILDFNKDVWNFENFSVTPMPIKPEDLKALKFGLENASKTYIDKVVAEGGNGYCYGMALTAALAKVNRLYLTALQDGVDNIHEIDKENAESIIVYHQLTQLFNPYLNAKKSFSALSATERLAQIKELADAVDSGGSPFILSFAGDDRGGWGHAVTAYSYEPGSFKKSGKSYNARILIYDNNHKSWDEDYCLYFNEGTEEWVIPAYDGKSTANTLIAAFNDINLMDVKNFDTAKRNIDSIFRAKLNLGQALNIQTDSETYLIHADTRLNSGIGVQTYYDLTDDSNTISGSRPLNIKFENTERPYTIVPEDNADSIDLSVLYENVFLAAKSDRAKTIKFDPKGKTSLLNHSGNFRFVLSGNEGYHPLPWYDIEISADGNGDISVSTAQNGYILKGGSINDLRVIGKNDSETKALTDISRARDVLIGEDNGEIALFIDNDDDGVYETKIESLVTPDPSSAPTTPSLVLPSSTGGYRTSPALPPSEPAPTPDEKIIAAGALYKLGLFVGTGTDASGKPTYELDKKLTRLEALALVIRLMGLENESKAYTGTNTFTDVPSWGDRYAAYGYNAGITAGINSEHTLFAPDRQVTFQEFTAFLLRALGYTEASGDFKYEKSIQKASDVGLFSPYELSRISTDNFLRGNAVLEMADALETKSKGGDALLLYKLADKNVFSKADADWFAANIK